MLGALLAYMLGRSHGHDRGPTIVYTPEEWARIRRPPGHYRLWRLTFFIGVFCAIVLVATSFI